MQFAAAITAMLPAAFLSFLFVFFGRGRIGCAGTVIVIGSAVAVGVCFMLPPLMQTGSIVGVLVGVIGGAVGAVVSVPKDQRAGDPEKR